MWVCAHVSARETGIHKELRDLCAHGFRKRMSDSPGFGVKGRCGPPNVGPGQQSAKTFLQPQGGTS